MKALVLEEPSYLVYTDVDEPVLTEENNVKIKIKAASVCGSDVHGFDNRTKRRNSPIIMGHEASGIVVEIGENVNRFKVGDRVIVNSTVFCGKCEYCLNGRVNLCDNRRVLGVSCDDYKIDGAYREFITVPERIVYKIPDTLSYLNASLVEPLSVSFHAAKVSNFKVNQTGVIFGIGTIGLFILQSLKLMGANKIFVVDIEDEKLNTAKALGADYQINSKTQDVSAAILKQCPEGVDVVFDVVGIQSVSVMGITLLKKGGTQVLVGLFDQSISYPVQKIISKEIKLIGSYISGNEYNECISLIDREKIDISYLIQNYVPMSQGPEWFEKLIKKEKGLYKVVFNPEK